MGKESILDMSWLAIALSFKSGASGGGRVEVALEKAAGKGCLLREQKETEGEPWRFSGSAPERIHIKGFQNNCRSGICQDISQLVW
jgi:hypothetical protein